MNAGMPSVLLKVFLSRVVLQTPIIRNIKGIMLGLNSTGVGSTPWKQNNSAETSSSYLVPERKYNPCQTKRKFHSIIFMLDIRRFTAEFMGGKKQGPADKETWACALVPSK